MNKLALIAPLTLWLVACPNPPTTDTTPPVLTLILEPASTTITAPSNTTLKASANEAVTSIEFFDGPNKIGEDATNPYEHTLNFTAAQNGSRTYTARGVDLAGNSGTSSAINLTVNIPVAPANWFVDPVNGADSNTGVSQATAFKTICKAKDAATTGQVIALLPGVFDGVNQNKPPINGACNPSFTQNITLRALEPFNTVLRGINLSFQNGGTVEGLKFENDPAQGGQGSQITATAGLLNVNGLYIQNQVVNPNAIGRFPLALSGTAQVTLTPGAFSNYLGGVPDGKGLVFALVNGSAQLNVQGGTFVDQPASGNSDPFCAPLFSLNGTNATVTLNGVTVRHKGSVARVTAGTFIARANSVLEDVSIANNVGCLPAIDLEGMGNTTLEDSTLQNGVDGIATDNGSTYRGTVTLIGATIKGFSKRGVFVAGSATTAPTITVQNSSLTGNAIGLETVGRSTLTLRGSSVQNNTTDGLKLTGNASASFDLGTNASPGNNTIQGNTLGLRLNVPSGVIVNAIGNTWKPDEQQSNAQGKYVPTPPETFFEFTAPAPIGTNFSLQQAGSILRL